MVHFSECFVQLVSFYCFLFESNLLLFLRWSRNRFYEQMHFNFCLQLLQKLWSAFNQTDYLYAMRCDALLTIDRVEQYINNHSLNVQTIQWKVTVSHFCKFLIFFTIPSLPFSFRSCWFRQNALFYPNKSTRNHSIQIFRRQNYHLLAIQMYTSFVEWTVFVFVFLFFTCFDRRCNVQWVCPPFDLNLYFGKVVYCCGKCVCFYAQVIRMIEWA